MRWILAFHLIFMVCWFAGLFYLPRLFVYHALCTDHAGRARFKIMERKLFFAIMTPAGILTTVFGVWLFRYVPNSLHEIWMQLKLLLATLLWAYHLLCGYFLYQFKQDRNTPSHRFYRWFNEIPTFLLIGIIILAIVQP